MSRQVIRDIVIPIITQIVWHDRLSYPSSLPPVIQDPNLEQFLEEEMRKHFGVIGANECQHLKEQIEEAKKNDPYAFEFLIRQLLKEYIQIASKLRLSQRSKELEGPPDRFSEFRRKYNQLYAQEDSTRY